MSRDIISNLKFKQTKSFDSNAFSKFVEEQYLKDNRTREMQKVTFSPSSIGGYNGLCPRYWYIAFKGATFVDSNDALGIANMKNGTAAHSRIESLMQKSGIPCDLEVEIKMEDPPIRGYIDMMLEWDKNIVVGEFKTTRQEVFLIRQATMKPSPQHLLQVLIYLKATGKTSGFLLYENKNTQEFLVIPVELNEANEKIIEEVFEWMRLVYKNYQEGELPKHPVPTKKNKICKGCPVWDACWNNLPKGAISIGLMEVPKI